MVEPADLIVPMLRECALRWSADSTGSSYALMLLRADRNPAPSFNRFGLVDLIKTFESRIETLEKKVRELEARK